MPPVAPQLFGLLNINKPAGQTSRRVVDQVKRLVRPTKVGHAGTLDPLATGVLVVCIGQATRLVDYVQQMPKSYRAEFLLGRTSPTDDVDGLVSEFDNPPIPSLDEAQVAATCFIGEIQQRPPAYSAIRVAGRRAYSLARKGKAVELEARPVTVHELKIIEYSYPKLVLEINCSSGTYVRSIGRDLAEQLDTGAVMSALVRTAIGGFRIEDAIDVDDLTKESLPQRLLSPRRAVEHLPPISLDDGQLDRIARGQFIDPPQAIASIDSHEFAAFDERGNLAAILRRRSDGQLGALLNFRPQ